MMKLMLPLIGITVSAVLLLSPVSCSFERGDRYWSGKPQPIGIDFAATHVIAIYANGTDNFTALAAVGKLPGNEYGNYMYALHAVKQDWGNDDLLIIDDDDEIGVPSESWLEWGSDLIEEWKKNWGPWACRYSWPLLRSSRVKYPEDCFREQEDGPRRPRSRYRHLVSQSRMKRLREILPKWFRNTQSSQMTRSKLIIYIVEYLERIKQLSIEDHGLEITSAIISRPSWANNEYDDIFDEACLVAGIEVLEQPHSRVDMATKSLSTDRGPVLVLDHGFYYLNAHRSTWDEHDQEYHQRSSVSLNQYGTMWILSQLANRIIRGYISNVTEEENGWPSTVLNQVVFEQVMDARLQIKFRRDWLEDLEFENRTVLVNLTDSTGFLRALNMTGEDVQRVEQEYVKEIYRPILDSVLKHVELHEYMSSLYDGWRDFTYDEYKKLEDHIIANVTAPPEIGSWIGNMETCIILDTGSETLLLLEAARIALGQNASELVSGEKCVPTIEIAARGAALRARDWIKYWEPYERERLFWERFDEDDPDTWESEDEDDESGEGSSDVDNL